ncbi:unnamed protein product [Rangifer tarandus platyrhynchus]|uniref:Uncharacterized protein n=1 Tax=Rangifer tarandus platyrhynchus TaxID=3082113 RepID=A0ABN8XJ95_RANTA|nr:unnamed protein product [Rangifer tarandus platyrhynchus]
MRGREPPTRRPRLRERKADNRRAAVHYKPVKKKTKWNKQKKKKTKEEDTKLARRKEYNSCADVKCGETATFLLVVLRGGGAARRRQENDAAPLWENVNTAILSSLSPSYAYSTDGAGMSAPFLPTSPGAVSRGCRFWWRMYGAGPVHVRRDSASASFSPPPRFPSGLWRASSGFVHRRFACSSFFFFLPLRFGRVRARAERAAGHTEDEEEEE